MFISAMQAKILTFESSAGKTHHLENKCKFIATRRVNSAGV